MSISLGTYIRQRRLALGLTQEQLADRIGEAVTQADISRLERDRITLPRRDRMEALANALNVSLGDLLLHTGWMTNGDGLAHALDEAIRITSFVPDGEPLDPIAAAELVASVREVQAMVVEVTAALARAQQTLDTVLRKLDFSHHPRALVPVSVGLMDSWETSTVFLG